MIVGCRCTRRFVSTLHHRCFVLVLPHLVACAAGRHTNRQTARIHGPHPIRGSGGGGRRGAAPAPDAVAGQPDAVARGRGHLQAPHHQPVVGRVQSRHDCRPTGVRGRRQYERPRCRPRRRPRCSCWCGRGGGRCRRVQWGVQRGGGDRPVGRKSQRTNGTASSSSSLRLSHYLSLNAAFYIVLCLWCAA